MAHAKYTRISSFTLKPSCSSWKHCRGDSGANWNFGWMMTSGLFKLLEMDSYDMHQLVDNSGFW
jgi:hypothetical protein